MNKSPAHVNSREVTVWWCGSNWQLPQLVRLPGGLAGSSDDGIRAAGACGRAARPSAVGEDGLKCRCPHLLNRWLSVTLVLLLMAGN